MIRPLVDSFLTAFSTLTAIPFFPPRSSPVQQALPWFPWIGLGLGSILASLATALSSELPPSLLALLLLLLWSLLTGSMHLDGLADAADGLFALKPKSERLLILKDPRLGSFGVISLFFALTLKWQLLVLLLQGGQVWWLLSLLPASRAGMAWLAYRQNYANRSGTGKNWVDQAKLWQAGLAWAGALACAWPFGMVGGGALLMALVSTEGVGFLAQRRLGGITGDLLGAAGEVTEILTLLWFVWANFNGL